ncbi:hypothetical protein Trydic_g5259 [Trypoxylus dichotomus]
MHKNPHIIVIGAGIAGIAAARRLFDNGYTKITILEAESRIGGRINSVKNEDNPIEYGAQWCHGESGNIIYNMVKDYNLLGASFNDYQNLTFCDSSGKELDKKLTDILCGVFEGISYDEERLLKEKGSFGDYFLRSYNEKIGELFPTDDTNRKLALKMLNWFHNFTLCYDGAYSWFDISASGLLNYEECDGNLLLHWKQHGFSTIFDILIKKYPTISEALPILETIHFGKVVDNILWDSEQCRVHCKDGSSYSGDHVIFTASLGVLKEKYKKLFTPELPLYKRNAIEALGIGTVNKIFVKFPYRWWPNDCVGFSLIWSEEDRLMVTNEFPYGPVKDGKSWLEDIFGFYTIDGDTNTLMGWNVGSLTREVEVLADDIVFKGCRYLLDKFLGAKYNIPTPESVTRTKWYSNEHFRGSYSYRTVHSDRIDATAEDLARPLSAKDGKLTLLFAGEATHPYFYSTAHGALETGFREAQRIIELYANPQEKSCNIAIIGCGMAGLGAATTLLQAGIEDFLILEASDKPGGRVDSITFNGNVLELGAQWLHGTSNYLHRLATENDLILDETSEEGIGVYVRNDGYIFDDFIVKKIDFIVGKILEECENFVDSDRYPFSVEEFIEKEFKRYLDNSDEDEEFKEKALELYDWHYRFQVIDNSCLNLKQVSARDWGKYSFIGTDRQKHMNLRNGYQSLLDILVRTIPKESLVLETPVLKVDYSKSKIRLGCRGNLIVKADHVIATPSVGFLKQNLLQFHPPLPEVIRKTIKNLGFHGMGKIYLVFEKKWWKVDGFQLVWRRNTVLGDDRDWIRYVSGFDTVLNQPNVLVGWIGGEGINRMELLSEETVGVHCVEVLRMFLKDSSIPLPINVIKSTWTSNPWVRGAYSHTTPACDLAGCGPSTLAVPVEADGVPKIFFAGEAVHESNFSTTHGAFESGQRQAGNLLKFLRRHKL